jgi:hypothetical protein
MIKRLHKLPEAMVCRRQFTKTSSFWKIITSWTCTTKVELLFETDMQAVYHCSRCNLDYVYMKQKVEHDGADIEMWALYLNEDHVYTVGERVLDNKYDCSIVQLEAA